MGSARGGVGTQGPAPLMAQCQEFGRLIALGVNNSEACHRVGVNRRTGTRWRFGRTITSSTGFELHYPPVAMTNAKSPSTRFLSEDERVLIGDRVRAGASPRAIGRELGRAASTVSREVRRNRDESGRYRPFAAQRMAVIFAKDEPLGRDRYTCLRTRRRRRRPHRHPDARRPGRLREMTMIGDRSADVQGRVIPGHWEGDLITGAANRSAIGTLVERTTRYVLLVHLPTEHTANTTCAGVVNMMGDLPAKLRRSLTWDQGVHSAERLVHVQDELNNRPRKSLGWQSPPMAMAGLQSSYS